MANFLYVDNSNVWIEGMHVAAVATGIAPDIWTAQSNNICDYGWKLDFGRRYEFAGGGAGDGAVADGHRGRVRLLDCSEANIVSRIDDHSRFCISACVVARATAIDQLAARSERPRLV